MAMYLSKESLDGIAARVLRAYKKLPEVQENGYYFVDTALLVKELLRLNIEYRHLSRDRLTLGLTCFDETAVEVFDGEEDWFFFDGKTVLIEEDLRGTSACVGRHNFTLAHEGCHHILKMLFPGDYIADVQARRILRFRQDGKADNSFEEWKVNALTSAILMPEELIRQGLELVGLGGRIEILNAKYRPKEYEGFCQVCNLLGVSKQALAIRMRQLGLLGKEYLRNPYDLVNVYMEDDEIGA
jgi:hypothetical protein